MRGLGNIELRESLWEKQYWKGSEGGKEQKLVFDEVEKLCRGLNINSSREDLERLFSVCKISASLVLSLTVFFSKPTYINDNILTSTTFGDLSSYSRGAPKSIGYTRG